ncbi:four helix bundle protein [Emticicia sp. W12TSBA100-4]|uniref:four helix bundle protein n=1 Tax=Emticicia sp. W12TSBA100-4 TaxID=3160965 RepID=UPI003305E860
MSSFKDLIVYKKAFSLSMEIFEVSKGFPKEEKYSLTDQVRRSSRSVCANIGEAYRKRRYPAHFISKLTDSDAENSETQVWIDFAFACEYIDKNTSIAFTQKSEEVGRLINHMIANPEKYL